MGGIVVVGHFSKLWSVISRENSKMKAFPFFFWIFLPILLFSSIANWFDPRLIIGTVAWVMIAYTSGNLVLILDRQQKTI